MEVAYVALNVSGWVIFEYWIQTRNNSNRGENNYIWKTLIYSFGTNWKNTDTENLVLVKGQS